MAAKKPKADTANIETQANVVTLEQVIQATKENSFVYTSPEFHTPLLETGKVVINAEMIDDKGNIATRAINFEENENQMTTENANPQTTVETQANVSTKPVFTIEADVPIPDRVRRPGGGSRAGRTAIYPFDKLEVGQSFFVPNKLGVNEHNEPFPPAVKAMASTVANANEKYSEVIEGQTRVNRKKQTVPATRPTRKFKIFDTERANPETGVIEKGARIFRVALED